MRKLESNMSIWFTELGTTVHTYEKKKISYNW